MSTYRIIKEIADCNREDLAQYYIVRKRWFGWQPVYKTEGPRTDIVLHASYNDAEKYLIKNYTGFGKCTVNGNEYTYTPYMMYF